MADIARDETSELIASNKVEGTTVYNPDGEKLGSIHNFMVDKRTGQVEYAVLQFGGLLGIGTDYYPLPWEVLEYDEEQGGYVVEIDKDALKDAPHFGAKEAPVFGPAYGAEIYGAYGLEYPIEDSIDEAAE
jgi:sporulation protein YlmC with PRC-barrel domain